MTWYLLAVARLRTGDPVGARTAAAAATKRPGTAALGHSLLGRISAQQGDHAAALESFTDGLAVGGGDWTRLFDWFSRPTRRVRKSSGFAMISTTPSPAEPSPILALSRRPEKFSGSR